MPEQAPDHPVKSDPAAAVGVRVTSVPYGKFASQVGPQLIPEGSEVISPEPLPDFATESVLGPWTKEAVTLRSSLKVSVQVGWVPEQSPPQSLNSDP